MLRGLQTLMNSLTTPVTLVIAASNLGQSTQFNLNIISIRLNEVLVLQTLHVQIQMYGHFNLLSSDVII